MNILNAIQMNLQVDTINELILASIDHMADQLSEQGHTLNVTFLAMDHTGAVTLTVTDFATSKERKVKFTIEHEDVTDCDPNRII